MGRECFEGNGKEEGVQYRSYAVFCDMGEHGFPR